VKNPDILLLRIKSPDKKVKTLNEKKPFFAFSMLE